MVIEELARNYVSLYKTSHNKQVFLGWEKETLQAVAPNAVQ